MTAIFITATGTDSGKTFITKSLLEWDGAQHSIFSASKPIISGWPKNKEEIQHTDTGILLQAQSLPYSQNRINQSSPWRYFAPLTPDMAAKREGKEIIIEI